MAEMLNVRVMDTGEKRIIPDTEPTQSAQLFWQISDEIWRQKPDTLRLACYAIESQMPPKDARDALNEVLGDIDRDLVVSGTSESVKLTGFRPGEEVELAPELLNNPLESHVGTFNWDQRNTWRYADIDGKKKSVEFTDGHKDRHRELYVGFNYIDGRRQLTQLKYSMQRIQQTQDHTTSVSLSMWHSQFAETGYEGSQLKSAELRTEQEIKLLRVFQAMGGITLRASQK